VSEQFLNGTIDGVREFVALLTYAYAEV